MLSCIPVQSIQAVLSFLAFVSSIDVSHKSLTLNWPMFSENFTYSGTLVFSCLNFLASLSFNLMKDCFIIKSVGN